MAYYDSSNPVSGHAPRAPRARAATEAEVRYRALLTAFVPAAAILAAAAIVMSRLLVA